MRELHRFNPGRVVNEIVGWTNTDDVIICQSIPSGQGCRDLQVARITNSATRSVYDGVAVHIAMDDAGLVILALTPDSVLRFDAVTLKVSVVMTFSTPFTNTRDLPTLAWSRAANAFIGSRCGQPVVVGPDGTSRLAPTSM